MSDQKYRLVFKGELSDGFTLEEARLKLAQRFNKDPERLDVLFSGRKIELARELSYEAAQLQIKAFSDIGIKAQILVQNAPVQSVTPTNPVGINQSDVLTDKSTSAISEIKESVVKNTLMSSFVSKEKNNDVDAKVDRKSWLRYRFDTFMAKGGTSIFKALTAVFLISFLLIAVLRGLFQFFFPEIALQYENLGFLGNAYITFLQLTDPGNMAQDILSSPGYKIFSVIAGLIGVILLSALIAFITTALDQKINELKRGRSKVIEEEHTLILGWNEQRIIEIIRELIMANESEDDACVVILADKDKEEMDDALRLNIPDTLSTRLVTRSGSVSTIANLDMVSIENCRSVIILADCEDTDSAAKKASSDAKAIQTVLATTGKSQKGEDFSIVVEIFNATHREIIQSTFPEHVVTVNTTDILAKLLVQTSRSVGLSVVYNEILSFDGCELYFHEDDWQSIDFGTLSYRFPDGVPLGVRHGDGKLVMRPGNNYQMQDGDELLILADDDSTIDFLDAAVATPNDYELAGGQLEQSVERELILGWNHKSSIILSEFADYVKAGSEVDVLLKNASDSQRKEIAALNDELDDVTINLIEKDCLNPDELMSLRPFEYDNIIILASEDGETDGIDAQQVDSENIVALLLLRSIFDKFAPENNKTKLITEVLDSQNYPLVARAGVKDVIISNRLVSMIMAQISESRDIQKVYDDIFQEDGSEIYLKPAALYFKSFPMEVTFADMMNIAQKREEICLGIKIQSQEMDNSANNGVQLIPEKSTVFTLNADDSLVVLAEDEL